MKKITLGVGFGILAGVIDVIPMILQDLTWDANISAFTMWVIVGFLISVTDIAIPAFLKGILIAFLVLIPTAILIAWKEPLSLLPISIMTLFLGATLGYLIQKINNKK